MQKYLLSKEWLLAKNGLSNSGLNYEYLIKILTIIYIVNLKMT